MIEKSMFAKLLCYQFSLIFLFNGAAFAHYAPFSGMPAVSGHPKSIDSDIVRLIRKLDHQKYESRESATNELAGLGEDALESLAYHFYSASPEAAWRIKRILQQIGTQSRREVTSLKAIGLLILLDHQLDTELAGMLETWRTNRSQRAIDWMVSKGAVQTPNAIPDQRFNGAELAVRRFNVRQAPLPNPLRRNPAKKKLEFSEAKPEIEKVVKGDLETVQDFVFSQLPEGMDKIEDQLIDDFFIAQAGINGMGNRKQQTILEIGSKWNGDAEDLEKLKEIHSLYALRISDQTLNSNQIELISALPGLQHIGFNNTNVSGGQLADIQLPDKINSIELRKQKVQADTIDWLSSRPLVSLTLDDCQFTRSTFEKIRNLSGLQYLTLQRLKLDRQFFDNLTQMSAVQRVFMSVCKFDADDYRRFAAIRPRVIVFNPVSFLGVQGTPSIRRPGTYSCRIEAVVPNSGAEAAGVLPGDIVEAVNGSEIQSFDELRMFISQLEIGEKMTLRVMRGDEELELSAVLGTNEDLRR